MKRIFLILLALLVLITGARAQDNALAHRPLGQHTISFSTTPIFDASSTTAFKMTLTGNVVSSTLAGVEAGQVIVVQLCQDVTGGRTFAPPSQFQGFTTISASSSVCTVEAGEYDGTNLNFFSGSGGGGGSGTVNAGTINQCAKYVGSGTTVGGSTVCTDDGTTFTYSGTGGISAVKFTSTGTGAGALNATEGAVPAGVASHDFVAADSTSHSMQLSNNGGGFQSLATWCSTSPTQFGIVVGGGFPCANTIPTGNIGQPILSGGASGNPGVGPLNLAGGATFVTGILPSGNLPTVTVYNNQANTYSSGLQDFSAVTFKVPIGAGLTESTNALIGYDSTSNNFHGGLNGADSRFASFTTTPTNGHCVHWVNTGGNILLADDGSNCGAGASVAWNGVSNATAGATTDNGDFAIIYRTAQTTAGRIGWRTTETTAATSTGTPFLLQVDTLSSSTANPVQFCAGGTSNCARFDKNALLSMQGSATVAIPGTTHGLVVSEGAAAATATPATGAAGQVLISNGSGADPSFQDPIVSQAYVNLFSATAATGTATSSAVRNPFSSQSGTFIIKYASITGSPSGCTLQVIAVDSLGNTLNDGSAIALTVANGTVSSQFSAAAAIQDAAQMEATYACSVYPGAGTISVDFAGTPNVNVNNTVAANVSQFGGNAVVTGTGVGGSGIPRVTVSSDSSLAANQSVNVNQVAGAASSATNPLFVGITDGTNGAAAVKAASTSAVATDKSLVVQLSPNQPNLTSALNVALAANQSVNLAQMNGVALGSPSNYGTSPGTVAVQGVNAFITNTVATLDSGDGPVAPGAAASKTVLIGCIYNTILQEFQSTQQGAVACDAFGRPIMVEPNLESMTSQLVLNTAKAGATTLRGTFGRTVSSTGDALDVNVKYPAASFDPCLGPNKTNVAISTAANVQLITGTTGPIRVCSIFLVSTSAETFSVVEGTGATCGTNTAAVIGSTTAANGPSIAANGGYAQGNGAAWIASAKTTGNNVCILLSGSTLVSGNLTYAY